MSPPVSVIVSSFDRPNLLADALRSIAWQAYDGPIEIIICDDYSTDPNVELTITRFAATWPDRFTVTEARPEHPPVNSLERIYGGRCALGINAGLAVATGRYVVFLPDDDFLTPHSIACRVAYLEAHPQALICFGRLEACKPETGVAWPHDDLRQHWHAAWPSATMTYGKYDGDTFTRCVHDRNGFFAKAPITRAANYVDHGMVMVCRDRRPLPDWPEHRTCEITHGDQTAEHIWTTTPPAGWQVAEEFDCPDAGWFYRLEQGGYGPFHPVDEVVIVKRYHKWGHRGDPSRRE